MARVIIEVQGGIVQETHTTDPTLSIDVLDHDNLYGENDPQTVAEGNALKAEIEKIKKGLVEQTYLLRYEHRHGFDVYLVKLTKEPTAEELERYMIDKLNFEKDREESYELIPMGELDLITELEMFGLPD